jgi:RND family efflux transporter MFP subunit
MNNSKNSFFSFKTLLVSVVAVILSFIFFIFNGLSDIAVVIPAKVGSIQDSVNGNVVVLAEQEFDLRSESSARANFSILLPHGKPVKVDANQTLFTLDISDVNRNLNRLLLNKENHQKRLDAGSVVSSQLKIEETDLKAVREISKLDAVADLDLKKKESHVARLRISLEHEEIAQNETSMNLEFEIEHLKKELEKRIIKSPIPGMLVSSTVKPGDFVFGSQVVGKVLSHDRLIRVSLNEEDFEGLKVGQRAGVTLFSSQNVVHEAVVDRISATIDPSTGRRDAYLKIDSNVSLPVGSSGRAEIIKRSVPQTLIIPRKALLGDVVLCIKDAKVKITSVKIGASSLNHVEILDGLSEGDLVISETPHLFHEGQKVKLSILN